MTITINIPPDAEEKLRAAAREQGQDLDTFAVATLLERVREVPQTPPDQQELRERLERYIGVCDVDIPETAGDSFGEYLLEKKRSGHL